LPEANPVLACRRVEAGGISLFMASSKTIILARTHLDGWASSRKAKNPQADAQLYSLLENLITSLDHSEKEIEKLKASKQDKKIEGGLDNPIHRG
jgi:hypothetical protein